MKVSPARSYFKLLLAALACAALPAVAAVAAAGTTTPVDVARAPKPLPFEPDEELLYQADFSKLMLRGIQIAEFRFSAGRVRATPTGGDAAHAPAATTNLVFKGEAQAQGWFRKLFGLDFHYTHEALVEPTGFLILRTTKLDEQGKRARASVAEFDRRADRVTWTERNPNDAQAAPRVVTNLLRDAAHDFISALYFLRTQPLAPGQKSELVVSDSGETYRIPVTVGERKTQRSVVGKVATLRVDLGVFGAGRLFPDRKGTMTLWLTDDARRLPVRARVEADLGTLDIKLKKVTGGSAGKK